MRMLRLMLADDEGAHSHSQESFVSSPRKIPRAILAARVILSYDTTLARSRPNEDDARR